MWHKRWRGKVHQALKNPEIEDLGDLQDKKSVSNLWEMSKDGTKHWYSASDPYHKKIMRK